jgi:cytochrome c-type biogenesis protein CcmH
MTHTIESLKQKLAQLQQLNASGLLSDDKFAEDKAALERQILALVLSPPAAAVPPLVHNNATNLSPDTGNASKPSGLLLAGLATGVVALAVAGYLWKGSPRAVLGGAQQTQTESADGNGAPPSATDEQITAMTEKLAQRLKDKPDDVEGWSMLARSYSVLNRHAEALKAYEKALTLRNDDPDLLVDYADALATNNGTLNGEPMKLVERALQRDPKNLKGLYLAGTSDYNNRDFAGAVKQWEKLVQAAPPGSAFFGQIQSAIDDARSQAGMPRAAKPLPSTPQVAGADAVSGTVTLSAALAKQAQPDDTVFVFARAADGGRMPLAILRKQVKDLPLAFTLDDSMAMSPASALSTQSKVIVAVRISKSGNAMPQAGDLSGQSAPVSVGATGVQIEIKDVVKP